MRYGPEHKEETRRRVLREAAKAIRAKGPDRVAVADVMRAAGLTHGGFYAHFPSKDAMVAAAVEEMFEDAGRLFHRMTEGVPPAEGLARYIDAYLSVRHRDARGTGCPMAALAADSPRLTAACRRAFAAGSDRLTARLSLHLRELGHEGADTLACSIVSELVGALSLARATPDAARSEEILAASRRSLRERLHLENCS